jgi:hypothetical protein
MKKHINKMPLMALAIIFLGISIAAYTNSSKNEAFGEQDMQFPDMAIIYNSLKEVRQLNARITNSYLNSSPRVRKFLDDNYYSYVDKCFKNTNDLITAIEKKFPFAPPPPKNPMFDSNMPPMIPMPPIMSSPKPTFDASGNMQDTAFIYN